MKQQFSNKQCTSALVATLLSSVIPFQYVAAQTPKVSVSNTADPLNPIIVTATRTPTKASDVLADNVYIGPEEIAQAGQTSLVELLQRQKGVTIANFGGGGSSASVFLRGTTNNQTLVLIDGVRVDDSFNGGANWASIPLTIIDHIEIIFGPQSSLYGADAIGGVIQIFTKRGEGPPKANASFGYGGYGTSISEASLYGSTDGQQKIRYSLAGSQTLSMGFNTIAPNNKDGLTAGNRTGYVQDSATGKVSQEWQKGQEYGLQFLQSRTNNQFPAPNAQDAWKQQIQNQISQLGTYAIYSKNQFSPAWQSLLQVSAQTSNALTRSPASANFGQYDSTLNQRQNIYTWQNDIVINQDTLQLLVERRTQTVSSNQLNYGSSLVPYPFLSFSQTRNTNSGAIAYQMKRGNSITNFSMRNDNITGFGPQTTGAASLGYFFTKEWRANINYGTGFRPPTFNDFFYPGYGNPSVQAEKSKNTEVGLQYEKSRLEGRIVFFSNSISNLIQSGRVNCPVGTGFSGCASNVSSANITGASVSGSRQFDNLSFKGSFTQQNPVNEGTNTTLMKQAKQYGNLAVEYSHFRVTAGVGATYSGRRNDYLGDQTAMGAYTIYNLYGNYELNKNLSLFGRWNNVFNKDYQLSYGFNTPGSNVFFGLRYAMQ